MAKLNRISDINDTSSYQKMAQATGNVKTTMPAQACEL